MAKNVGWEEERRWWLGWVVFSGMGVVVSLRARPGVRVAEELAAVVDTDGSTLYEDADELCANWNGRRKFCCTLLTFCPIVILRANDGWRETEIEVGLGIVAVAGGISGVRENM